MKRPDDHSNILYLTSKRTLDIVLVVMGFLFLSIPMVLVAFSVRLTSSGPILYWSKRFGKNNRQD